MLKLRPCLEAFLPRGVGWEEVENDLKALELKELQRGASKTREYRESWLFNVI